MSFHSIAEACRKHAFIHPDKICVIDGSGAYTYAQMWHRANQLCRTISGMGINSQDRIAVECTQNADFLFMAMACQIGKFIFVPVERSVGRNRVNEICCETDAKMLIQDTGYELSIKIPILSFEQLEKKNRRMAPVSPGKRKTLYLSRIILQKSCIQQEPPAGRRE